MTVGATGNQFRESKAEILAVIAFFVGLNGQGEYPVALHHFLIAVTLHANFSLKNCVLCRVLVSQWLYLMETVAVVAGRGILIAGHQ